MGQEAEMKATMTKQCFNVLFVNKIYVFFYYLFFILCNNLYILKT